MIQELSNKVWKNQKFQMTAKAVEIAWLQKELNLARSDMPDEHVGGRILRAAAILATSDEAEHRQFAYRVATCAYELWGTARYPLDQALRVVLARLKNFPAIGTKPSVNRALADLPWELAAEELELADQQTIVVNGTSFQLTDFQHTLWKCLEDRQHIATSAPTSAGKSFVLQTFLTSLYERPGPTVVVYIVPTRALITQVAEDLSVGFRTQVTSKKAPQIITVPLDSEAKLLQRAVYVMTQERVRLCLDAHPNFNADIVIVDEAHTIADGGRGVLLQWVIDDLLDRRSKTQILFASPLIKNLDAFGRAFGIRDVVEVPSTDPTVAQNFIIVDVFTGNKGRVSLKTVGDGSHEEEEIATFEIGHTLAGRKDKLVHIPAVLGKGQSNIVYANGAAESESVSMQLAQLFESRKPSARQLALSELVREAVHESYILADCVKYGIGFHYSYMPTVVRRAIEQAAASGEIDYLVCTSTLLQGVNLPAKNVFMFAPEKGKGTALESTDFWNLSGRAGRLRKEFQGNIFLIDYMRWKKRPLDGPKAAVVVPAVESSVTVELERLIGVITDDNFVATRRDDPDLESTFGKLYSDFQRGKLAATISKAGLSPTSGEANALRAALKSAEAAISLPHEVIRRTPNVSAHKQQRLYESLRHDIEQGGEEAAWKLVPRHPRDADAFKSYSDILERCHSLLLGLDPERKLHRFHALIAQKWMQGLPVPQIIDAQLRKKPTVDRRKVIRDTLEVIETQIRFQTVRLFGCYNTLLLHTLKESHFDEIASSVLALPLFLELGASDKTMISFISLGLSRVTAMKLNDLAAGKNMDPMEATEWLRSRNLNQLGLSLLLQEEIQSILGNSV